MTWQEYKRWLDNCASVPIVGKTAPQQPGDVQRNPDGIAKSGGKPHSPTEEMRESLDAVRRRRNCAKRKAGRE